MQIEDLALSFLKGIGLRTANTLLEFFGSAHASRVQRGRTQTQRMRQPGKTPFLRSAPIRERAATNPAKRHTGNLPE